jgi:hypothetical protein
VNPRVTGLALAGFALIVAGFIGLMALLDLESQSWGSFALLAVFFVVLLAYRSFVRRRYS